MGTAVNLYYTYSTDSGAKWELIPSKLLVVEDIASYLGTKAKKTISDFQYIKNELELSINVEISQSYSQPRSETNFKYVSIQNPDEAIHYYFVKKATWRSKACVRFELVLDVLNTFQEGRDYNFKPNTRIVREHKDRFKSESVIEFTFETLIDSGNPYTNGEKIYIKDDNQENYQYEGTLISAVWNALREVYIITIRFDEIITYDEIITWLSSVDYAEDDVIFYQDDDRYDLVAPLDLINTMTESEVENESYRNIDIVNEGVSPVLQCESADGNKIELEDSALNKSWYLLYRNQNDPSEAQATSLVNPVDCYLIPETDSPIYQGSMSEGRLTFGMLETGKFYYLPLYVDGSTTPDLDAEAYNQTITLSNGVNLGGTSANEKFEYVQIFKNPNNTISVSYYRLRYDPADDYFELMEADNYVVDYITLNNLPFYYGVSALQEDLHNLFADLLSVGNRKTWTNASVSNYIDNIKTLDRTDAKNIKLIKLPYVPYKFTLTSGKINVPVSDWNYDDIDGENYLKLNDLNIELTHTFKTSYSPLSNLIYSPSSPSINDLRRGPEYESKLFHSDFYQPTYVYDSFTYKVQLEKLDVEQYNYYNSEKMTIKFDMTRTINSRFMFTFDNLYFKHATENYAKYMPIARNNEVVLYNVSYLNYVRSGFNYDVKAKERTNVSNMLGMGLSIASTASALLLPSVPLKVAGVVAGLVSMAMSIKNTVVSAQQNEDSIRRKLQETANQTASVAGSDDVDLMSVYAGNRLKYLVYEPTPLMKSILFDLFFYAGYASGRIGLPNHDTRVNFDYLECEANLENEGSIPDDCLQELINCFKTGTTYLHKTSRNTDKWDFEQKYENWEKSIVED